MASFARFTLQLLTLGAPPELVAASLRAADDEIRHARTCFRLATRFGGEPVGPGPLEMPGDVLGDRSTEAILRATIREGCVGETISAHEVRAAARRAADDEVRGALDEIADDEARHAELAWTFVAWLLGREPALRGAAERAFREALSAVAGQAAPPPSRDGAATARFGILDAAARHAARQEALKDALRPATAALLRVE